jgi:hypothetical protein
LVSENKEFIKTIIKLDFHSLKSVEFKASDEPEQGEANQKT